MLWNRCVVFSWRIQLPNCVGRSSYYYYWLFICNCMYIASLNSPTWGFIARYIFVSISRARFKNLKKNGRLLTSVWTLLTSQNRVDIFLFIFFSLTHPSFNFGPSGKVILRHWFQSSSGRQSAHMSPVFFSFLLGTIHPQWYVLFVCPLSTHSLYSVQFACPVWPIVHFSRSWWWVKKIVHLLRHVIWSSQW